MVNTNVNSSANIINLKNSNLVNDSYNEKKENILSEDNILNNVLSPEEIKELDIRNENRYRTYISTEATLASWLRNTINLFMGGIAIITFSKSKEKYLLSLILSLVGILMGIFSYMEYKDRKKKIEKRDFGSIKVETYNEKLTLWIIIIFVGLFILRTSKITNKYNLKSIFKSK